MKKIVFIVLLIFCYLSWKNIGPEERTYGMLKLFVILNPFDISMTLDLNKELNLTEKNIESTFDNLYFGCEDEPGSLGDRVCWAYIDSFNDIPANIVAVFFKDGTYQHIRIATESGSHNQIKSYINSNFKYIGISPGSKEAVGQELGIWRTETGIVTYTINSQSDDVETVFLWSKE